MYVGLKKCFLVAFSALAAIVPLTAAAQTGKPLEWVVGYAAGGGSDIVARSVAEQMSKTLDRPIIVNNKPGAATSIAASYAAKSTDIGNIVFTADFATLAANPSLYKKLPYDPDKDFAPIGLIARFPMLLVVAPNVPAKNLKEFLAWAKSSGHPVSYASAGAGSPHHLTTELFRERVGLKLTHVPYRGTAPAVQDLLGGQIPFAFMDTAAVQQYVSTGKLRALGVASAKRLPTFPEIPTLQEQGMDGFEAYAWQGMAVPASTPAKQVAEFSKALKAALESTPVKARFQTLSLEGLGGEPEPMAKYVKSERDRWRKVIEANGIGVE